MLDLWSPARSLVIVAHPDDEILGCAALLSRLADVTVVHVTDGAPRDGADGRRHGFASPADYAAARRREAEAALALAGIGPERLVGLGYADQGAGEDLAGLARRLVPLLAGADRVLTHAFEGGHPDHDAVAFAVHAALRLEAPTGGGPTLVEMPFYHAGRDGWIRQIFRAAPGAGTEVVHDLTPAERKRKRAMAAAHASQAATLADFDLGTERFRMAPGYDFRALPEALLYERHPWGMTRSGWLARVVAAETELGRAVP